ncbi:MAG: hypothetical protein DRJ28_00545 [Actinobacteria bacterium]|nr:MAG: hypothetical protein DRJ28_00545 [Actinomycetota bacterium]
MARSHAATDGHSAGRSLLGLRLRTALLIALALIVASCGTAGEEPSTTDPTGGPPSSEPIGDSVTLVAPSMDTTEAVAALLDPATAEAAMIAILEVLEIGVYATDGTPIVVGAERGPDDLWLSMAEVSGLALAAGREPVPFERIRNLLNATAGTDLTTEDVASMYREMIDTLPEYPMSRVLAALGTEIRSDGEITPFEGWLLFVAMTPPLPNLEGEAMASRLAVAGASAIRAASDDCPPVGGGDSDPGFSLAQGYVGEMAGSVESEVIDELAEGATSRTMGTASKVASWWKSVSSVISKATQLLDVSKMWAIYENIQPNVTVSKVPVHEIHDAQGKSVESERAEVVASVRWNGMGAGSERCFASRVLGLPPPGPVKNAGVKFEIDKTLVSHGHMRRPSSQDAAGGVARQLTDAAGETRFWYEPKNERPKSAQTLGPALEMRETGIITAEFDFAGAFEQFLNPYGMIEIVFDTFDVNVIETPLEVVWHSPAARVTVVVDLEPPWAGAAAIDLVTCDGEAWTGSVTLDGKMDIGGGSMDQKGDVTLALDVQNGIGEVEFVFPVTATMTAAGQTITNKISSQQRLTLVLPEGVGPATVKLETIGGSQVVTGPGGGTTGSVDSWMDEFTAPIIVNDKCDT